MDLQHDISNFSFIRKVPAFVKDRPIRIRNQEYCEHLRRQIDAIPHTVCTVQCTLYDMYTTNTQQ